MGSNEHGQLGIDDPVRFKNSPVLIESLDLRHVQTIACGGNQSWVCSEEGRVFSWGEGQFGSLGLGTLQDQFRPAQVQVPGDSRIVKIDCGLEHSCLIDVAGRIFVCGTNSRGQLGLGEADMPTSDTISPIQVPHFSDCAKQVACGDYHTLVLSLSGLVYACGDNTGG